VLFTAYAMADPISVASATIALLSTATKVEQRLLSYHRNVDEVRRAELDVQVCRQKFQVWQEVWSGQKQQPDVSSEVLWGAQGWANIQRLLDAIISASKQLELALVDIRETGTAHPRSKWKAAVRSLRSKKRLGSKISELKDLAGALNLAIDRLWLYSETVFDSRHGVWAQELRFPSSDILLTSALQSRSGSLQLYDLCCKSKLDCSLGMDLLEADKKPSIPLHERGSSSMHLFYQLFTRAGDGSKELQKLVVENIPEEDASDMQKEQVMEPDISDLQIFKTRSSTASMIIPVARQGSSRASCLRIEPKGAASVQLKSDPESLAKVLDTLKNTTNLSTYEHFSIGAKVELAYKIVECGFFLLGTPWFSSLSSWNILRLKSARRSRHSFTLEIQTLDLDDLLFDDPGALDETLQLFRIGVLLMEIALDSPGPAGRIEDSGHDFDVMKRLPFVEQAMGAQYCTATAFCLQHRQPQTRFQGRGKYHRSNFKDWESYLSEFLQDYYSQVFLRLEELREIDTTSEFRSRKSWWSD
jgi:hypothetical protein